MKKLTDAQVVTLMFIMVEEPAPPADFTRFPTLRMFLEEGLVENRDGKLRALKSEELKYQYVLPDNALDAFIGKSFVDLEADKKLLFNATSEPTEKDTFRFYDLVMLKAGIEKLGGTFPSDMRGNVELPMIEPNHTEALTLLEEFSAKYPSKETSADMN